jgi:small multidrug resistance pump
MTLKHANCPKWCCCAWPHLNLGLPDGKAVKSPARRIVWQVGGGGVIFEALENPLLKMGYLYLAIAILAEIVGTSLLKATDGFTRLAPTATVLVAYGVAFWMMSLSLKTIQVAVVYAIWSGAGIVLIAIVGWVFLKQSLDAPAWIGIALILAGVVVINLFSNSVRH